jgi:uncharacterized membrane protein
VKVLLVLQPTVKLNPDPSKLPGGGVWQGLVNGIAGLALIACVAIFVVGAVMWALSSRGGNVAFSSQGKATVLIAATAALLIGGADAIINFFIDLGQQI